MKTYNVVFNNSEDSNDKGFRKSKKFCIDYINSKNGTNDSFFMDYRGGIVSVYCNETHEIVYEIEVI